jgi:hypothetical protein
LIILTAEAIKHKEWEMLAWAGGDERLGIVAQFLMRHPSSKRRHDNALLQFYDCLDAYLNGMINTEWLIQRFLEPWRRGFSRERAKIEYRILCEESPELIRVVNERREYERRNLGERTGVPF